MTSRLHNIINQKYPYLQSLMISPVSSKTGRRGAELGSQGEIMLQWQIYRSEKKHSGSHQRAYRCCFGAQCSDLLIYFFGGGNPELLMVKL